MKEALRLRVPVAIAAAVALAIPAGSATAAAAHPPRPVPYTCADGEIPSGTYASITVTGTCSVAADAVISVVGGIDVGAGATLDAQSVPSTITVGRNVTSVGASFVGLGCQPPAAKGNSAHECVGDPEGSSAITINGNVTVTDADTVMLNGITVEGNVTVAGGGWFIPWSIKNNTIARNLTVSGVTAEWVGVMFNMVAGNLTLTDITVTEDHPEASQAVYVVRNTVGRNLTCTGLGPHVSGGFVPGSVNVVGRNAVGQCASLV